MTNETQNILRSMVHMAQTYERIKQNREAQCIYSAIHLALDVAEFPRGEERAQLLGLDNDNN